MNLPSFLWLWKIAAWSMGLALFSYSLLGISGFLLSRRRQKKLPPIFWLRPLHYTIGIILVLLVLLLLSIGLIGTIGHYGSLGHSSHLIAGLIVVCLVLLSAWSSTRIHPSRSWARTLHVTTNVTLFFAFLFVGLTGLNVVQQYLP
jgi:hypothetical protein